MSNDCSLPRRNVRWVTFSTTLRKAQLIVVMLWLCSSPLSSRAWAESEIPLRDAPSPKIQRPSFSSAKLRVLETGSAPLQLLAVERGGQVIRFARGEQTFRFDVQAGVLVKGSGKPSGGSKRVRARQDLLVEADSDGTLRWRDPRAGARDYWLAFYPAMDGERWVLFTPSGYFDRDSSSRLRHGDWFVGWDVDIGAAEHDWFPLWHFAPYYYRPDVARRVLAYEDGETSALRAANLISPPAKAQPNLQRLLPPKIIVERPAKGVLATDRWLNINVSLYSPSGEPIGALDARVQGMRTQVQEVTGTEGERARNIVIVSSVAPGWQRKSYRVRVLPVDGQITLSVRTQFTEGEPVTIQYRWQGKGQLPLPQLDGLVVGISEYQDSQRNLRQAHKDASDLAQALVAQKGLRYSQVDVKPLLNQHATKQQILAELDRLAAKSREPDDVVVVFFSGHGTGEQGEGRYYFLPHDADLSRQQETLIESNEIKSRVDKMMGRILIFLDTCNAGSVFSLEPGSGRMTRVERSGAMLLKSSLADMLGVVVFAGARGSERAQEKDWLENGVFTKALLEGLRGGADFRASGRVTVNQLDTYVGDRVRRLTDGQQTPATARLGTIPDYEVAIVKVPLWRRRAFWPVIGGTLGTALLGAAITMGVLIKPDFNRGSTGWLAAQ